MKNYIKENKMVLCHVCKKEVSRLHKRSHIIPKFLAKEELKKNKYNEGPSGLLITMKRSAIKGKKIQDILWGTICCKECESLFARDDHFACKFFKEKNSERWIDKTGHEFKSIKKFIYGVVIKAHLYRKLCMKEELLSDEKFNSICYEYKNVDNQELNSFPIVVAEICKLYRGNISGKFPIILYPDKAKGNFIRIALGKYGFKMYTSNILVSHLEYDYVLPNKGVYPVSVVDIKDFYPKEVEIKKFELQKKYNMY